MQATCGKGTSSNSDNFEVQPRIWEMLLTLVFDSRRITRWIDEEEDKLKCSTDVGLQYVILDMSGMHEMELFSLYLFNLSRAFVVLTNIIKQNKTKQLLQPLIRVVQACLKKSRRTWTEDA